jgi:hypothetical protein
VPQVQAQDEPINEKEPAEPAEPDEEEEPAKPEEPAEPSEETAEPSEEPAEPEEGGGTEKIAPKFRTRLIRQILTTLIN